MCCPGNMDCWASTYTCLLKGKSELPSIGQTLQPSTLEVVVKPLLLDLSGQDEAVWRGRFLKALIGAMSPKAIVHLVDLCAFENLPCSVFKIAMGIWDLLSSNISPPLSHMPATPGLTSHLDPTSTSLSLLFPLFSPRHGMTSQSQRSGPLASHHSNPSSKPSFLWGP